MKTIVILLASASILSAEYGGDCDRDWSSDSGRNGIQRQLKDAARDNERSDNEQARREARESAEEAAKDRKAIKDQLEAIQRDARREKQKRELDEWLNERKIRQ